MKVTEEDINKLKELAMSGGWPERYDVLEVLGRLAGEQSEAISALIDIAKDSRDYSIRARALELLKEIL